MLLVLMFSQFVFAQAPTSKNAGCLIPHQGKVLLVKDIWSKRWSLPGGGPEKGETAEKTAVRELFEETGLQGEPVRLLSITGSGFHIFLCKPSGKIKLWQDFFLLPPQEAWNEVAEAAFLDPSRVQKKDWRFVKQQEEIQDLLKGVSGSASVFEIQFEPPVEQRQSFIEEIQKYKNKFLTAFFQGATFLGGEGFFILLFPFLWIFVQRRMTLELFFLFCETCFFVGFLKQYFHTFRPFHLEPSLKLASASGFGFPSGHATSAALLWFFLARHFRWENGYFIAAGIAFFVGFSRMYLGAHSLQDVLAGWFLGIFVFSFYQMELKVFKVTEIPVRDWMLKVPLIGLLCFYYRPHPEVVAVLASALGFMSVILIRPLQRREGLEKTLQWKKLLTLTAVLLVILTIELGFSFFPWENMTFLKSLTVHVSKYVLLGMVLGLP